MRILVSGARGFIGAELVRFFERRGDVVYRLTRSPSRPQDIYWNNEQGILDISKLDGLDVVVHLAGENIGSGYWTVRRKRRILESRERGTKLLCEKIAQMEHPPDVLISASGISCYSGLGSDVHTEADSYGSGFLANVCMRWEAATNSACKAGIRVVTLRLGLVLGSSGGVLRKMLPAFRMGLGGPIGDGKQAVSWISLEDVLGIVDHCISDMRVQGPVNTIAPDQINNRFFSMTLSKVLNRPCFFKIPATLIRCLLGEMGRETLLSDVSASPNVLIEKGYKFRHPTLLDALSHILQKPRGDY